MEIFWTSVDLIRLVFLIGAIVALLYKKFFGVTPGGVIVPGTLAGILFTSFTAFVIVLALSLITWLIYRYTFGRYLLSKRWTTLATISISVTLGLITSAILENTLVFNNDLMLISLIIPGLIAISARNYGLPRVALGTLSVTAVCFVTGWLLAVTIPYDILTYMTVQLASFAPLTLANPYILMPVSLITAILIYYRFGIRGGGYLIAPFIAAVTFASPIQALLLAVGVALSYLAVYLLQKYTLVIGLERFVFSLVCGYIVITACDLLAIYTHIPGYSPTPIVLIIAVAVLTNDLSLQKRLKTLKKGFAPTLLIAHLARLAV